MRRGFVETLIRACKRRVSGYAVNFAAVIGEVAAMYPEHVTDEDVRHHFAETLVTMALVQQSPWRRRLVDHVTEALKSPDRMAHAICDLAHTEVEVLRRMGLWTEEAQPPIVPEVTEAQEPYDY